MLYVFFTTQFGLAKTQVLSSLMWLVGTTLDSTALEISASMQEGAGCSMISASREA